MYLNLEALRQTPTQTAPFPHLIVPAFLNAQTLPALEQDFPPITRAGSFPLETLRFGPAFKALVEELKGDAFKNLMAEKLNINLDNRPTMLKGIHPLLTPDLLKALAEMGHGDEIVIADANFTAHSLARSAAGAARSTSAPGK